MIVDNITRWLGYTVLMGSLAFAISEGLRTLQGQTHAEAQQMKTDAATFIGRDPNI